jgi:hypothetical protein
MISLSLTTRPERAGSAVVPSGDAQVLVAAQEEGEQHAH